MVSKCYDDDCQARRDIGFTGGSTDSGWVKIRLLANDVDAGIETETRWILLNVLRRSCGS